MTTQQTNTVRTPPDVQHFEFDTDFRAYALGWIACRGVFCDDGSVLFDFTRVAAECRNMVPSIASYVVRGLTGRPEGDDSSPHLLRIAACQATQRARALLQSDECEQDAPINLSAIFRADDLGRCFVRGCLDACGVVSQPRGRHSVPVVSF